MSYNNFFKEKLTSLAFDDVLLVPSYSDVKSRSLTDLSTSILNIELSSPIISSPMDTVTESNMAIAMAKAGGLGIVHRFMSVEEQILNLRRVARASSSDGILYPVIPAVGVGPNGMSRVSQILGSISPYSIDAIAIDIANGHSIMMRDMIDFVNQKTSGSVPIIAGNVATGEGYLYLAESGASAVRVGIGGGSICKTRIMTGFGMPTLTSIMDCYQAKIDGKIDVSIIADGGIKYPADLVKSIVAGADAIMVGRVFAGTKESPGKIVTVAGEKKKEYRGMASKEVQEDRRGGLKPGTCAEGVSTYVPYNGGISEVIEDFCGGLRSAMTYAGVSNIEDLRRSAKFIRISDSGISESHAFGTRK